MLPEATNLMKLLQLLTVNSTCNVLVSIDGIDNHDMLIVFIFLGNLIVVFYYDTLKQKKEIHFHAD